MAVLVLVGVYFAWSLWSTRAALMDARVTGAQLRLALSHQDPVASRRSLSALQREFHTAHSDSSGPVWALASVLPLVGDDIEAVRLVARSGDQLAEGAVSVIVNRADGGLSTKLAPRGGRIDLRALKSVTPLVTRTSHDFNQASSELDTIRSSGLTRWVRPAFVAYRSTVDHVAGTLATADKAVQVLPAMLGKSGPRAYLVMFDTNAEIRATGGLPGAFSIVRTVGGKINQIAQGSDADFPVFDNPVLPETDAESQLYGDQMGIYLHDTNFTPEFPRTAALVRRMWERVHHQRVDGVVSIDAVSVAYLLRATGPIQVRGITLTARNAVGELLNKVYVRLPDPGQQDEFFKSVASAVFHHLTSGVRSPTELVAALAQSAREGRLYVHDFEPAVQRHLTASGVSGDLTGGDPRVPRTGFYLNDATGSKMSYFLRHRVRLTPLACADGTQELQGTAALTYTKDSPPIKDLPPYISGGGKYGTPVGQQLVLARIYGPVGGELSHLRVAGEEIPVDPVMDRGRPVTTAVVELRRGQTVRVDWRVVTGPHQDRPAQLTVTPGLEAVPAVTEVASKCGS